MEEKRICDYFVVAGVPDLPRKYEDVYEPSLDPITDITVIIRSQYEPIPKGYVCIEKTPSGHVADLNHGSFRSPKIFLCYKRGRDKPPLIDIGVWYQASNEKVNSQCNVLEKTHSGFPANVNNSGTHTYLTYWRSSKTTPYNQLVVSDICVIFTNKNETPPPAYNLISKNLNKGIIGSDVYLCYKKTKDRPPNLIYKPVIINRYPLVDYSHYPLFDNLPLFCLPMGATIECWHEEDSILNQPSLSTFVLTSNFAEKVYASLLNFYEPISPDNLTTEELKLIGFYQNDEGSLKSSLKGKCLQRIKSICILSLWPFFDQFKHFLVNIFKKFCIDKSPKRFSLESYIFHFMKSIPFPSPERPNIMVNVSHFGDYYAENLLFSTFDDLPIPSNGASFRKLLVNLGSENCLYVMLFVLTEQKILLHSLRLNLLTELAEAIVTMIFPFNWNCPYIPMCPISLSGVLNAPLPFIVGIDSRYFDQFESPSDVVSIDVDTKAIFLTEHKRHLNLKMLPKKEMKVLKEKLDDIYVRIQSSNHRLSNEKDMDARKRFFRQIETEIQDAFLYFMASILKDFRQYLKPIITPKVGATDPTSLFDVEGFLNSRDQNYYDFYLALTKTQMFTKFIEERSLVSDKNVSFAFFDDCIEKVDQNERLMSRDQPSKLTLIEFDDRTLSNKTVFIAISDLLESSEQEFLYPYLGLFDQDIFSKLESQFLQSTNFFSKSNDLKTNNQRRDSKDDQDSIGLGMELQSYMLAKRAKHEVRKALNVAQQASKSPLEWAKCLLVNSYSLWFTHFPSFSHVLLSSVEQMTSNKIKPLSVAYKVLQRMQSMKFSVPDEFCYRILMILCGVHSQPALAVKVFLDMQKHQVRLNAITYGYYNKAVLYGNWPTTDRNTRWSKLCNILRVMLFFRRHIKSAQIDTTSLLNSSIHSKQFLYARDKLHDGCLYNEQAGILIICQTSGLKLHDSLKLSKISYIKPNSHNDIVRKRHKSNDCRSNVSQLEISKIMQNFKNSNTPQSSSECSNRKDSLNKATLTNGDTEASNNTNNKTLNDNSFADSFSDRFSTPIKDAMVDLFSPKSRVGLTLRSSFRIAKNFTKTSKYGFSRNPSVHNSEKNLNNMSSLFGKSDSDKKIVKRSSQRLPRSSTLPQTLVSHDSSNIESSENLKNTLPSAFGSPWTTKLSSGKHSDYVYSTFKLAANRLNELKSSFSTNSSSISNSPVKLNMANVMASLSQLTNFNFDDDDNERETGSTLDISCYTYSPESYCELLRTVNEYYFNPIELLNLPTTNCQIIYKVQILSSAFCQKCESIIYDEEIMCKWFADDSNLNTKCIHCNVTFVPSLTIYIKDFRDLKLENAFHTLEPISVPYLSPLVLRKEFENILNREGYNCLIKSQFVDDHPIVYWNLLWYFTRLNLPSHIPGLALIASSLNTPEIISFNNAHKFDYNNVSIDCSWDSETLYENIPLHHQWLKIKNNSDVNSSSSSLSKDIFIELVDLISNRDISKPIQYLISERLKSKLNNTKQNSNSIYRELLFLTLIEIPDRIDSETFDSVCKEAFEGLTSKDKEMLSKKDLPPPIDAIHCRNLFKRLSLT